MIYINDFNRGLLAAGEGEAWRSPRAHYLKSNSDRRGRAIFIALWRSLSSSRVRTQTVDGESIAAIFFVVCKGGAGGELVATSGLVVAH